MCIKTVPLNADTLARAIVRVHAEAFTEPLVGSGFGRCMPMGWKAQSIPLIFIALGASTKKSHR